MELCKKLKGTNNRKVEILVNFPSFQRYLGSSIKRSTKVGGRKGSNWTVFRYQSERDASTRSEEMKLNDP